MSTNELNSTVPLEEEVITTTLSQVQEQRRLGFESHSFLHRTNQPTSTFLPTSRLAHTVATPSSRQRIFLVRHGHSLSNQTPHLLQVCSDHTVPLAEEGREQAAKCGSFLRDYFAQNQDPTRRVVLWVSPYKRTRETAAEIEKALEGVIEQRRENIFLAEQQFGLFEGLSLQELESKYPYEFNHFQKAVEYGGRFWARMPLGESRFDVALRLQRMVDSIRNDQQDGVTDVIIVSHGVTTRVLAMCLLGRTPEWLEVEPNPANCSVRLLEGSDDRGYIFEGFGRKRRRKEKEGECDSEEKETGQKRSRSEEEDTTQASKRICRRKSIPRLEKILATQPPETETLGSLEKSQLSTLLSHMAHLEEQLHDLQTQVDKIIEGSANNSAS